MTHAPLPVPLLFPSPFQAQHGKGPHSHHFLFSCHRHRHRRDLGQTHPDCQAHVAEGPSQGSNRRPRRRLFLRGAPSLAATAAHAAPLPNCLCLLLLPPHLAHPPCLSRTQNASPHAGSGNLPRDKQPPKGNVKSVTAPKRPALKNTCQLGLCRLHSHLNATTLMLMSLFLSVCVCVCVCVRARMCVCVCVCVFASERASVKEGLTPGRRRSLAQIWRRRSSLAAVLLLGQIYTHRQSRPASSSKRAHIHSI